MEGGRKRRRKIRGELQFFIDLHVQRGVECSSLTMRLPLTPEISNIKKPIDISTNIFRVHRGCRSFSKKSPIKAFLDAILSIVFF